MKMKYLVSSFLLAGSMILGGIGVAQAGDLKVSGFGDVLLTITDENADGDPSATPPGKNTKESKFGADAEVDFEREQGSVVFRLDLDFPANANPPGGAAALDEIEQLKFVWALPVGPGLTLTGGVFNSPIGFEAQDAPDKLQTSNGQLFNLLPSNLVGIMVSGSAGPASVDLIFGNEWRNGTNEENTFGARVSAPLMGDMLGVAVGFLSSEDDNIATADDEDLLDVVLSGMHTVAPDLDLTYALEFLTDDNNEAYAIVVSLRHNSPNIPHGVTVRWDTVDCDSPALTAPVTSFTGYCSNLGALQTANPGVGVAAGSSASPNTLTVAAFAELSENLTTRLEWTAKDSDLPDASFAPLKGEASDADLVTLEFIATF